MKTILTTMAFIFAISLSTSKAHARAQCELESVKTALKHVIEMWNIDGAAIGTSFKAKSVKLKPGSEGIQGTFTNIVELEVFEAGRGSTLTTTVEVDAQELSGCQTFPVR